MVDENNMGCGGEYGFNNITFYTFLFITFIGAYQNLQAMGRLL